MFCEHCAALTRGLTYDPEARPRAELLSGSCTWDDEFRRGWCFRCISGTRALFWARYCMTVGDPVPPDIQVLWERTAREFPAWPLFRPERRSPRLAPEVRRMVETLTDKCLGDMDRRGAEGGGDGSGERQGP